MLTNSHSTAEPELTLDGVLPAADSETAGVVDATADAAVTRAVIVTGELAPFDPELFPTALAPIVDRPFIQHVVESLIRQDISSFDIILGTEPQKAEALLGDGCRWGTSIRFHLTGPGGSSCQIIRGVVQDEDSPVVFVSGEQFSPDLARLLADHDCSDSAACVVAETGEWAGLAVLPGRDLAALAYAGNAAELEEALVAVCSSRGRTVEVSAALDVSTAARLLATQHRVLSGEFPELLRHLRETANGVWIGRNSSVPASAELTAPVFLGEHVDIGEGAKIGPGVVVNSGCVIGAETLIENSLVLPGTCIGEQLELRDSIVAGRRMFNARLGAALEVPDEFLIGDLNEHVVLPSAGRVFSRGIAILLLVLFSPVIALTWCILRLSGPALTTRSVVRLAPQRRQPDVPPFRVVSFRGRTGEPGCTLSRREVWRHFLCEFLPGLIHVVRGELAFTGVTPSSEDEIAAMPEEWQQLYLQSQAGLINEAFVRCGTSEPGIERYISDAHFAVQNNRQNKLNLTFKYLQRMFL